MYTLQNGQLTVSILDPAADAGRFGVRYCTGGYIFQVEDSRLGPLLSGPTYPESFNWFDGQGIPDAFNLSPLRDPAAGPDALVIGIGVCDLEAKVIRELCRWDVAERDGAVTMRTSHAFGPFALELERTVALRGRTVTSSTRLHSTGSAFVPVRWFPHPFYPQPEGEELCKLNIPVRMADSPGYAVAPSGFIARRAWPEQAGFYQPLDHDARAPLVILQRHPALGVVAATCSYIPSFFPIWGNQHTFSWEPFLERTLAPGQELEWSIDYDF